MTKVKQDILESVKDFTPTNFRSVEICVTLWDVIEMLLY